MSVFLVRFDATKRFPNDETQRAVDDLSLQGHRELVHFSEGKLDIWHPISFKDTVHISKNNESVCAILGECWGIDSSVCRDKGYKNMDRLISSPEEIASFVEMYGDAAVADFDGIFVYLQYDKHSEKIKIFGDYLGLKPLFFVERNGSFLCSSEFQPIIKSLRTKTLNKAAVASYVMYGVPFRGEVLASEVKRLQPSSSIYSNGSSFAVGKYYESECAEEIEISFDNTVQTCRDMCSNLMKRLLSDGKIEYFPITGGYDTRVIMSLFDEQKSRFTWTTNCSPFLTEESDKDVIIAKQICALYGLKHNVRIASRDESNVSIEASGLYENLRHSRDSVNLNGHFSYYVRGQNALFPYVENPRTDFLSKDIRLSCAPDFLHRANNKLYAIVDQYMRGTMSTFVRLGSGGWLSNCFFFQRSFRSPFLGSTLHKFLSRVPKEHVRNGSLYIGMLKNFSPELMDIPFISRINNDLSIKILDKGVNYLSVRKLDISKALSSYLLSPRTYLRGIYSLKTLFLMQLKILFNITPVPAMVRNTITSHWRYKKAFPDDMFDVFIKLECMLRDYID